MEIKLRKARAKIKKKIIIDKENLHVMSLTSIDSAFVETIRPTSISDKSYWKDSIYYLIHTILYKCRNEDYKTGSKYVALQYDMLKKVMGNETTIIIDTLISNNVIQRDEKYAKGKSSFGYKICENYKLKSKIGFKTLSNPLIIKRFKAFRSDYMKEQEELLLQHDYIVQWLLDDKLIFLDNYANEFIQLIYQGIIKYFNTYHKKVILDKNLSLLTKIKQWSDTVTIHSESLGKLPTIGNKGLRLNSFITSMYSPLRNFLLYRNIPIAYVDISNSQPFHFLALLHSSFWKPTRNKTTICLQNLNNELYEWINRNHQDLLSNTIMTLEYYESIKPEGFKGKKYGVIWRDNDKQSFSYLVMHGKLYKFISDKFSGKFLIKNNDPFSDKVKAKQSIIQMLYSNDKISSTVNSKHFKLFSKFFPKEADIILLLKKRHYSDFSILLQNIESNMMLKHVCKDLYKLDSSIPMYTIHDGILTPFNYKEELMSTLNNVYTKLLGVTPEYSIKELRPSNLTHLEFQKLIEKKSKEFCEDNNLTWLKPKAEFILQLYQLYNQYYDGIKEIPSIFYDTTYFIMMNNEDYLIQ